MAKFRKKSIFIVILALCLALCLTLVACNKGNTPTDTAKYSVTVKIGETPQPNVTVELIQGGTSVEETTGADGKASFELAKGTYEVSLSNLPANYVIPENATLTVSTENPDLVISLEEAFAYVVKLVNPDGSAFEHENVYVGVCTFAGSCHTPFALGEGGVAYIYDEKGEYHVKITGTGFAGYAYECDEDGYYTGKNFSETETEMTIIVYPVEALEADNGAELTNEDRTKYSIAADATAYKYTLQIKANESVYFSLTPGLTGQYGIYASREQLSDFKNKIDYFTMDAAFVLNGYRAFYNGEQPYEANKTYYYMATNNTDATITAEIIVVYPSASYVSTEGVGGTLNLTASKDYAVIQFQPTQAGYYTFVSQGNALTYLDVSSISSTKLNELMADIDDSEYKAGNSVSIKITADVNNNLGIIYIGVAVKSDEAVSFDVKINQVNRISNSVTTVSASANLEDALEPEDGMVLTSIPMRAESNIVEGDDGYYHYGDENGAIVYVLLTESLDTWDSGAALAYYELTDNMAPISYIYDVTTPAELASTTTGNSYKDYRLFIRGFKDYDYIQGKQGSVPVIPSELEQPNCYANHVNSDGAYPLTGELKSFLQDFAKYNEEQLYWSLNDYEAESEHFWMFALCYYAEETEADAIVGEYRFESLSLDGDVTRVGDEKNVWDDDSQSYVKGTVSSDEYKIVVNKNGTFTLYEMWNGELSESNSGYWSKEGETYTFAESGYYGATYEVEFNPSTGYLKLSCSDMWGETIWEFYLMQA